MRTRIVIFFFILFFLNSGCIGETDEETYVVHEINVQEFLAQDRDYMENEEFESFMISVKSMPKFEGDEILNVEGEAKTFRLLLQLIEDFELDLDELSSEIDYYKFEETDSNELALFRYFEDIGISNSRDVMFTMNYFLVISRGSYMDWKFDDNEDLLFHLNRIKYFKENEIEIKFSEHGLHDEFEVVLEKNKIPFANFMFKYSSSEYHDAYELTNTINPYLENEGVTIVDAYDGSDSYNFIVMENADIERLKGIYGQNLDKIFQPAS